jgi:hypothetical protein
VRPPFELSCDAQIIIRGMRPTALALLVAAAFAAPADVSDRVVRTIALKPGAVVRVDATIADLTIAGSNRTDVRVEIVRRAPSAADLAKYPALVEDTAAGIHVSAVQAGDGRDATLKSQISIAAPIATVFQAVRVFEGKIALANLKGAVDVDLRRGPIEATGLAGRVRLESGIGGVDVSDSDLTPGGMMRLRVFNGPLRVRFPRPPPNARILAVTFNGTLSSDIPLTKKDTFGPRFGETTLGSGEPVMNLDVVKGDITISVGRR